MFWPLPVVLVSFLASRHSCQSCFRLDVAQSHMNESNRNESVGRMSQNPFASLLTMGTRNVVHVSHLKAVAMPGTLTVSSYRSGPIELEPRSKGFTSRCACPNYQMLCFKSKFVQFGPFKSVDDVSNPALEHDNSLQL